LIFPLNLSKDGRSFYPFSVRQDKWAGAKALVFDIKIK